LLVIVLFLIGRRFPIPALALDITRAGTSNIPTCEDGKSPTQEIHGTPRVGAFEFTSLRWIRRAISR
jgi:hypothetical protein